MTAIHTIACPIPFPLKTVNCYYIHDTIPTLIDSGVQTPQCLAAIEAGIRDAGGSVENLKRIIITHAHTDHAGAAGQLARRSGARIYLHHRDYPKFISGHTRKNRQHFERFMQFLQFAGVPDDVASSVTAGFSRRVSQLVYPVVDPHLLQGDEAFDFDEFQLQVVPTPGHTIGAICLFNSEFNEIISGDTLLEKITPNPVVEVNLPPSQQHYCSVKQFRISLDVLAQYDAARVLPGHGMVFTQANARIQQVQDHFERRSRFLIKRMSDDLARQSSPKPITLYQLTRSVFAGLEGMNIFLGLSEIYAFVQVLKAAHRVAQWQQDGVGWFQLTIP